jgi:chromate reductase
MSELLPEGAALTVRSLADIPLYNGDLDVDGGPASVRALKAEIDAAEGLIIATPEYNYGVPGVLKNAIDWVSRPAYESVLVGKPVAIVGAAPGLVGTARAQGQLRNVLFGTLAEVFPHPEVLLGQAQQRMNDGKLTDETSRKIVGDMLARFVGRIQRSARGPAP